jgi:hypothetical protein
VQGFHAESIVSEQATRANSRSVNAAHTVGGRGMTLHVPSPLAMPRKKLSTTIYITPEQNAQLKLLNEKTKVPVAEYIRQGIDLVLEKYRAQLPGQVTFEDL